MVLFDLFIVIFILLIFLYSSNLKLSIDLSVGTISTVLSIGAIFASLYLISKFLEKNNQNLKIDNELKDNIDRVKWPIDNKDKEETQ